MPRTSKLTSKNRAAIARVEKAARRQLDRDGRMSDEIAQQIDALAKQGVADARYALATWHLFGQKFETIAIKRNFIKAAKLLKLAASKHHVSAHYDLAVCYETGKGVGKSLKRAFQHYMQAAQQGDDKATHSVGRMYFHGIGVRKDRAAADIWLDRAEALAPRKR